MSSHHFVKDGQEPALLILDALSFDITAPLLEWAPVVLTAETAAGHVLSLGIKIDVLLCSESSAPMWTEELKDQVPVKILPFSDAGSALTAGLGFLDGIGQRNVIILTHEAEPLFPVLSALEHPPGMVLIDGHKKWSRISSGQYEKWWPEGAALFFYKSDEAQEITASGLKRREAFFETEKNALVRVSSGALFWVGEML